MPVSRPSGGLTRRDLLRAMGLGGVALAGGTSLAACATSVDQESGAATTGGDPAARLTMHHDAAVGPLFQPYVDYFNERYGPLSLDTSYVTTDYAGTTNTQLAGGGVDYDVLFTDPGHSQRWYDNGWITKLDDFPGARELTESWLPGLLSEYQAEDGSLIALPYYRGIELFLYNAEHLERIGAQPPETWAEFVEQCRELKSAGVAATPYSPFWTTEASVFWYELVAESFSDGAGPLFGERFEPDFADDPVVASTLDRWRTLTAEGLVPRDIFTTAYGDVANVYAGGKSSFTIRYGPQAKGFRDPKASRVADVSRNALMPGSTRETLSTGAQWCLATASGDQPQAWTLLNYLAARDKNDEYHVPKHLIALGLGLFTPYEEVNSDPEVVAAWREWADTDLVAEQLAKSRTLGKVTNQPWYGEFLTVATSALQDTVRGRTSVRDGLTAAADFVRSKAR
jgi:ABC-type glycerol-3-phosphate transport system substrate-binding protein